MDTSTPEETTSTAEVTDQIEEPRETSFAETALTLAGKSELEAKSTGVVDRADDQVEELFAPEYQTVNSPAHRAVWDKKLPVDLFSSGEFHLRHHEQGVMEHSLEIVARRKAENTLLDSQNKLREESLDELAEAGYWGLLVDKEYGGEGVPFVDFAKFITAMATVDPTIAGLASVHGCIGAVDPIRTFGTEEQKRRFLPMLASGERLSAFALTEPGAGSDLTALSTRAELRGDHYYVTGEKLFITNARPGRLVALVVLIDDRPAVLIADLPKEEDETFRIVRYGIHALKHTHNNGLTFKDFPVPTENLLQPVKGDGLTIAYHGLNRGRVALCANAAGTMRTMLAGMLPWAKYRETYGEQIAKRELVRRRVGRLAGSIIACDALTEWCGWLLDSGYRGEMECIVAKIFGSEAQKEAAIEFYMKTHGGRSFLHGHLLGDHVHEFLAPCIYEGEGEMLGMAFFKSLVKEHGKKYFEPIGKVLAKAGIKKPNPLNPVHAWKLRKAVWPYLKWRIGQMFHWSGAAIPAMPKELAEHAKFATKHLKKSRLRVNGMMQKFQLKLADRQCAMAAMSSQVQNLIVMLVTTLYAAKHKSDSEEDTKLVHRAADVLCRDLRQKITGELPDNSYYRTVTQLGADIAESGFEAIAGVEPEEILMRYE